MQFVIFHFPSLSEWRLPLPSLPPCRLGDQQQHTKPSHGGWSSPLRDSGDPWTPSGERLASYIPSLPSQSSPRVGSSTLPVWGIRDSFAEPEPCNSPSEARQPVANHARRSQPGNGPAGGYHGDGRRASRVQELQPLHHLALPSLVQRVARAVQEPGAMAQSVHISRVGTQLARQS